MSSGIFPAVDGRPDAPPHLTLWVWLDAADPPPGRDPAARAGEAFRRHGARHSCAG